MRRAAPRLDRRTAGLLLCGMLCACVRLSGMFKAADPLTADQHFRLGAAFERQGRADDAARQYQRVVRLDPDDPEGWVALGNLDYLRGEYARAEDSYLRALNVAPMHTGAQNNLALAYLAQNKKIPEAEQLARAALRRMGPLRPYVLDTLARIYERESRFAEARAAAQQAAAAATSRGITLPQAPEPL
jgi:tetratricopeptide (TPR) repeat protein